VSDYKSQLTETTRTLDHRDIPAGHGRAVSLVRVYHAAIDDVWDALTNPERIPRWFSPVTGDLRLGGHYQVQGNAGGEILRCEPPRMFALTWVFGEAPTEADITEVVVRLTSTDDEHTQLELEHTAVVDPERWAQFGPGAVGVGWDLSMLGLGLHLEGGEPIADPNAWFATPEARQFMTDSSEAWGRAHQAAGGTREEVETAVRNTTAFYVPEPEN